MQTAPPDASPPSDPLPAASSGKSLPIEPEPAEAPDNAEPPLEPQREVPGESPVISSSLLHWHLGSVNKLTLHYDLISWPNCIVPFAMEFVGDKIDCGHVLVADFSSDAVFPSIKPTDYCQSLGRSRSSY